VQQLYLDFTSLTSIVKYVALLAFNKIVLSHPHLVKLHQDVILECIDDGDVTIRARALDLVIGMVDTESLEPIVGRLMKQLRSSSVKNEAQDEEALQNVTGPEPAADSDDADPEESLKHSEVKEKEEILVPYEYKIDTIRKILQMCSKDLYSNISDFQWYIDVLVQLVRFAPHRGADGTDRPEEHISEQIGAELRNVAVRVKAVRLEATRAAGRLITGEQVSDSRAAIGALIHTAWIVGEYADHLDSPLQAIDSLLQSVGEALAPNSLAVLLQSIMKVYSRITTNITIWSSEAQVMIEHLTIRIVSIFEGLLTSPYIEVQERAVEYVELLKLVNESLKQKAGENERGQNEPPLLLSQVVPALFRGSELNAVAQGAQQRVPADLALDLDTPFNNQLTKLIQLPDIISDDENEDSFDFYYRSPGASASSGTAISRIPQTMPEGKSHQESRQDSYLDPDILAQRRAERMERYRDDPFYIGKPISGASTPGVKVNNDDSFDIDAIPIMKLDLNGIEKVPEAAPHTARRKERILITADDDIATDSALKKGPTMISRSNKQKGFLHLDSTGIGTISLDANEPDDVGALAAELRSQEEMAKAMKEIERVRLEMQRASERIEITGDIPPEGIMIQKKKKKKKTVEGEVKKKKKKTKPSTSDAGDKAKAAPTT
jgi:AP-3 complex subunit delta-1